MLSDFHEKINISLKNLKNKIYRKNSNPNPQPWKYNFNNTEIMCLDKIASGENIL